jgi:ABC-type Na+ efflux pump permease subunit
MPARTPIADLEEIFEVDIDEDDVDTVYGLLTKLLGRVPIVGNSAVTRGLKLTAVDSAGRRKKVSTVLVEPAGESNGAPADLRTQEESKVSSSSESSDASRHENQDNDDSRSDGSRSSDKRNTSKHDKYSIDRHSVDKHGIDKHSDDAAQ